MRKPQPREGREGKETQQRQRGGCWGGRRGAHSPTGSSPSRHGSSTASLCGPCPGFGLRQHWGAELPWVLFPLPWGGLRAMGYLGVGLLSLPLQEPELLLLLSEEVP